MTTTPLQLTPLGPYIGARVDGIDLSHPIDDALAETLQAVLTEHLVLVFPGQALSEDDQIRFAGPSARSAGTCGPTICATRTNPPSTPP